MTKRRRSLPLIFFASLVALSGAAGAFLSLQAAASQYSDFNDEITAFLQQSRALTMQRNYAGLAQFQQTYETPHFTMKYANGRVLNSEQNRNFVATSHDSIDSITSMTERIVSVTPVGTDYIAEYDEQIVGLSANLDGDERPFIVASRVRQYWDNYGAEWKLGGSEVLWKSRTVSGVTRTVTADQSKLAF